jgi:IS30 family transposase
MAPRLDFGEREQIALGRAAGESVRCTARRLHRAPSTVLRKIAPDEGNGQRYLRSGRWMGLADNREPRPRHIYGGTRLSRSMRQ